MEHRRTDDDGRFVDPDSLDIFEDGRWTAVGVPIAHRTGNATGPIAASIVVAALVFGMAWASQGGGLVVDRQPTTTASAADRVRAHLTGSTDVAPAATSRSTAESAPPREEKIDAPACPPAGEPVENDSVDLPNDEPSSDGQQEADTPQDDFAGWPLRTSEFNPAVGLGGNRTGSSGGIALRSSDRQRSGGLPGTQRNLMAALRWLRDHQKSDGGWHPIEYPEDGRRHGRGGSYENADGSPAVGFADVEIGLTGLATLAFLGAGYTHQDGEFQQTVHRGLRYMRRHQDADGGVGGHAAREHESFMYGHAICSLAMTEAYAMTGSVALHSSAQRGVDFLVEAQNVDPDRGRLGWRYGVRPGVSDTSVTTWCTLALRMAAKVGLEVPDDVWEGALRHFDDMTGPVRPVPGTPRADAATGEVTYRTGYLTRAGLNARLAGHEMRFVPSHAMSAANVFIRFMLATEEGEGQGLRQDAVLMNLARQIADNPPTLADPAKLDHYYWHFGSLALFQMGSTHLALWEEPMRNALNDSQNLEGSDEDATVGSWDSLGAWGAAGGRVYATAINCLTLKVHNRYRRAGEQRR